jgi:hypothetical protein
VAASGADPARGRWQRSTKRSASGWWSRRPRRPDADGRSPAERFGEKQGGRWMHRAKAQLGVKSRRTGFGAAGCWFWYLPTTLAPDDDEEAGVLA